MIPRNWFWIVAGWALMVAICAGCASAPASKQSATGEAENLVAVRQFIDAYYHQGNTAILAERFAADCVFHDNDETIRTAESIDRFLRWRVRWARDLSLTIDDIFASGDRVAVRISLKAIAKRTGKPVFFPTITIVQFESGKVVEVWQAYNDMDVMKQLGLPLQ